MPVTGDSDDFGDRMKAYECAETGRAFDASLPVYARIDGRSFSNFTRSMRRPEMSRADRETTALRDFVKDIADGDYNVHGMDARNGLDLLQKRARKLLAAILKTPCVECHLAPGETCDICGAKQPRQV